MIDPSLPMKTLLPSESILSDFSTANDPETLAAYHLKKEHYKILISRYDKLVRGFDEINALIQETISGANQSFVKKSETHPCDILLTLQKKVSPSDYERLMAIETDYHRIRKGPKNQDVERWLDEWMEVFSDAKIYGLGEVAGNRPLRPHTDH